MLGHPRRGVSDRGPGWSPCRRALFPLLLPLAAPASWNGGVAEELASALGALHDLWLWAAPWEIAAGVRSTCAFLARSLTSWLR